MKNRQIYSDSRETPRLIYSLGFSVSFPGWVCSAPLVLSVVEDARLARVRVVSVWVGTGLRRTVVETEQCGQVGRRVQENSRFHSGHENGFPGRVLGAVAGMPLLQFFELRVQSPGKVSRVLIPAILVVSVTVVTVVTVVIAVFSVFAVIAMTATAAAVVMVVVDDRKRRRRCAIVSAAAVGAAAVVLPHAALLSFRSVNNRKQRRAGLPPVNRRGDDGDDDTWQTRRPSGRTALNLLDGYDGDSCACERVRASD